MANITEDLNKIQNRRYGYEIRMEIWRCLDAIDQQLKKQDEGEEEESDGGHNGGTQSNIE